MSTLKQYIITAIAICASIALIFFSKAFSQGVPYGAGPDAAEMDRFWEELISNVGKAVDKEEEEGKAIKAPAAKGETKKGEEKKVVSKEPQIIPKDPEQIFLNPITQTIEEKGKKKTTKLAPATRRAFLHVKRELTQAIDELLGKIEVKKDLSPLFKDKWLPELRANRDLLATTLSLLSDKAYLNVLLMPPQDKKALVTTMKEHRETLIDLLRTAKKINSKVKIRPDEELKAEEETQSKLSKFARKGARTQTQTPRTKARNSKQKAQIQKSYFPSKYFTPKKKFSPVKKRVKPLSTKIEGEEE